MSELPTRAEKPRFVAEMFGRIAPRYDLMNTLITVGQDAAWRQAVAEAVPGAARRVLDVGAGTGKLAWAIAQRRPAALVTGADFALPMLLAGRPPRATAADALALPYPPDAFDVVVSAFVVRNLADVQAGLAEQVRVLQPGGRLIVLEITPGPGGLVGWLFRLYFRRLVPFLGGLIAGDTAAYTYLPASAAAFLAPEHLAALLDRLGLQDVRVRRLALGSVALLAARRPSASPPARLY